MFNWLAITALIDDKIFCIYGGLSPDMKSIEQLIIFKDYMMFLILVYYMIIYGVTLILMLKAGVKRKGLSFVYS